MGQATVFFVTVFLGIICAFIFDLFRVIRKIKKYKKVQVHLQDALFWLISSLGVLYFILNYSDGEIRFFYILGLLLGAVLYFVTISYYIRKGLVFFVRWVIKVVIKILKVIYKIISPVLFLVKKIYFFQKRQAVKVGLSTKKTYDLSKERLQKSQYYEKIRNVKKLKKKWQGIRRHKKRKKQKRKNEKTI